MKKLYRLFVILNIMGIMSIMTSCDSEDIPVTVISISGIDIGLPADISDVPTLVVGDELQLSIIVTPSDTDETEVYWASSDEAVATVSDLGLVTAVGKGTATITVTSTYNPDVTKSIFVTVESSGSGDGSDSIGLNETAVDQSKAETRK